MSANARALRAQLESIRSGADAALALIGDAEQRRVGPCEHKDLKDISSFGQKRFVCRDCGAIVDEAPEVVPESEADD